MLAELKRIIVASRSRSIVIFIISKTIPNIRLCARTFDVLDVRYVRCSLLLPYQQFGTIAFNLVQVCSTMYIGP